FTSINKAVKWIPGASTGEGCLKVKSREVGTIQDSFPRSHRFDRCGLGQGQRMGIKASTRHRCVWHSEQRTGNCVNRGPGDAKRFGKSRSTYLSILLRLN